MKKAILGIYHIRGPKKYLDILNKNIAYSEQLQTDELKIIAFPECKHNEIKNHLFDECILHKFEEERFYVLPNYHEWLTTQYGNYMELPKEIDRISPHNIIVYWK